MRPNPISAVITVAIAIFAAIACTPGVLQPPLTTSTADGTTASPGDVVDWTHLGRMSVPGHHGLQADVYRYAYITSSDRQQVATARLAVPVRQFETFDTVAHLHGTIGFADHCAPSRMPGFGFETPLNPIPGDMVANGRIVVMPDYPGLGVPGRHRYIERAATGRSVWDSLHAARRLVKVVRPAATVTNRVVLTGHSQGGHATFAALATRQARDDFDVVGAVAFAPPGDAAAHAQLVADGEARAAPLAWGLMSYAQAYPDDVDRARWFTPRVAERLPELMENRCAPAITVWLGPSAGQIFSDEAMAEFRSGNVPDELQPVLERERFDDFQTDTEIIVFHGTNDGLLPQELSRGLADRLREQGNDVEWHSVSGAGHLSVPRRARADVLAWVDARLAADQ